jgi:hypothetical protein
MMLENLTRRNNETDITVLALFAQQKVKTKSHNLWLFPSSKSQARGETSMLYSDLYWF